MVNAEGRRRLRAEIEIRMRSRHGELAEAVADGGDAGDTEKFPQDPDSGRYKHDGREGARYAAGDLRHDGDDEDGDQTYGSRHEVGR